MAKGFQPSQFCKHLNFDCVSAEILQWLWWLSEFSILLKEQSVEIYYQYEYITNIIPSEAIDLPSPRPFWRVAEAFQFSNKEMSGIESETFIMQSFLESKIS